jgi:hypothetical protein
MADASFGSGGTNDGRGYPEEEEAHRIPDFAIFRLPLQKSIRKTPPLPSALIENKSIRLEGLPINAFMMDLMADDDESKRDRFAVALLMSETIEQAREQLECLFQEYPLIPGEPDTLSKVYFMIIVGGWFHIEEVTRDNWKNFPANNEISATYMFEGDGDKTISRELLELWPKLRV